MADSSFRHEFSAMSFSKSEIGSWPVTREMKNLGKRRKWNDRNATLHSMSASRILPRKRVREFLKGPPSPPVYKQRSTKLAPYKAYLKQRFAEDGRGNSLQFYREVCSQGYDGCCSVITSYVTQLRQLAGTVAGTGVHQSTQPKPLKEDLPAPSQIRWWFVLPVERLTTKQQAQLLQMCQGEAEFSVTYQLVQAFIALLHQKPIRVSRMARSSSKECCCRIGQLCQRNGAR